MKLAKLILVLLFSITICSCKKDGKVNCGIDDPINNLGWLKDATETTNNNGYRGVINSFEYINRPYFDLQLCVGCPDFGGSIADCAGIICSYGGFTGINYCDGIMDFDQISNRKLIWKNY